ncbi:Sodium channel protein type 1 subunit alpha [Hondaea fermentalgiana]|uniref:Sodium channel protein type 1 subunit alpha n=1 Tax=Hondaea fermentalgiana TaxID=2315210 RepID=A0A2R5GVA4_9STRA|nr:Sodium channel protein type 1 subunit alpha [Hondaea fermentalgiana]|eukprot:GBG32331.1 Sodium channel protein type 1 subunit alpha [Hondaea fermentalgiana]
MAEDRSGLRDFAALLTSSRGAQVLLHGQGHGPPVRAKLRLEIAAAETAPQWGADAAEMTTTSRMQIIPISSWHGMRKALQRWRIRSSSSRIKTEKYAKSRRDNAKDFAIADIQSVILGRETANFERTQRYMRSTSGEHALDLEDLGYRCFSIIVQLEEGEERSIDIEVPAAQGGRARRDRLAYGVAALAGRSMTFDAPKSLSAATHQPGVAERLHTFMFGRPVTIFLACCIFVSVTVMACLTPLLEVDSSLGARYAAEIQLASAINTAMSWIFTIEVVAKILAFESLVFYLSDPWNALDFFVVAAGWLSDLATAPGASATDESALNFTALRALRALRVLRTFKMLEGIREIVDTFIKTLKAVVQCMLLYFYFVGLSAIVASGLWQSTLKYHCALFDESVTGSWTPLRPRQYCSPGNDAGFVCPGLSTCVELDASPGRGFLSFLASLNTLYAVSVRAGLGEYLRGLLVATDSSASSVAVVIFFVVFNLFVSGMVFSIFIAIIRNTFTSTQRKAKERKYRMSLKIQRESAMVAPARMTFTARATRRVTDVRSMVGEIVKPPESEKRWMSNAELCFTSLFLLEMGIKVLALGGFRAYLGNVWNAFDFVVVTSSVVGIFASSFVNLSLLRILRLLRVVRLLRRNADIVRILMALIHSFPQLANLILFCGLVFSVFGIMGMQLYGAKLGLPTQAELDAAGGNFTEAYSPPRANFDTFPAALLTLFQMMTGGAQWPIYYSILESSMGSTAPIFFLTFGHAWFKGFILFVVMLSSVSLTLESPARPPTGLLEVVLEVSDMIFLAVFTLEFGVKVIAYGFVLPSESYLRSGWNWLDFVVLIVSYVGLAGSGGSASRVLRTGRILRPLRMINRNEGLKIIVDALLRAAQPVSYTILLLLVYFFTFGLVGMEAFMGLFWRCNDASVADRAACTGHFVDADSGILLPRVWAPPPFGFDSIGDAFATLIETVSLKGWPEKLYVAMDTTAVDAQPQRDAAPTHSVFFVVFIYFGSFFMMKLFVGVIVGSFRKYSGNMLLTADQLEWVEMKRVMAHIAPRLQEPKGKLCNWCYQAFISGRLNIACTLVFLAHLLFVIVIETMTAEDAEKSALEVLGHTAFVVLAIAVHCAQILGAGVSNVVSKCAYNLRTGKLYRRIHLSNTISIVACVLSLVALVPESGIPIRLLVALRGLDFSRLIQIAGMGSATLRHVLQVLSECLLLMLNVTLVFFMVLFIYAVLGMQMFATVKDGAALGVTASFVTFPEALLTIFQVAAGDNWIKIMRECGVGAPACMEGVNCGSFVGSRVFFYSFFFICFGVFLNLYTATIVDAYESKLKAQTTRWAFSESQLVRFQDVWAGLDPSATGRISTRLFCKLFYDLGIPFVFGDKKEFTERQKKVQYNQARFEIFDNISTRYPCALPNGEVAKAGEPSVSFFEVLQVVVMVNVDESSMSTEERVHRASGLNTELVEYLRQQGYAQAAQTLLQELEGNGGGSGSAPSTAATTATASKAQSQRFESYEQSYSALREWVLRSLDKFRDELWPVLWVVFAHSALSLAQAGDGKGSARFVDLFRRDHEINHLDEIVELSALSTPAQVQDSPLGRRLQRNRFEICMSQYACELLLGFVIEHNLLLVLSIINERTDIKMVDSKEHVSCLGQTVTGVAEMDATANMTLMSNKNNLKSIKVFWGVPKSFQALMPGATGALAASAQFPATPADYLPNGEPASKDPEEKAKEKSETQKLEEDPHAPQYRAARLTKLDRHNLAVRREEEERKKAASANSSASKGKGLVRQVDATNHTPGPDAEVTGDKFVEHIEQKLLREVLLSLASCPEDIAEKTLAQKALERAEALVLAVGMPDDLSKPDAQQKTGMVPTSVAVSQGWPSVALQTFFNAHDALICAEALHEFKLFAAGFDDSVVRVWSYPSSEDEESRRHGGGGGGGDDEEDEPVSEDLYGHAGPVYACSFSPDGTTLLTASADGTVRLWMRFPDLVDEFGDVFGDDGGANPDASASPAGSRKRSRAGISKRRTQGAWRNVFSYKHHPDAPVWDVRFSPAGYYFVSGSHDNVARLWSIESRKPLRLFVGHLADVDCVQWHPNCLYVATGSTDKTVRTWNVATGDCTRVFCGHTAGVNTLAFAASGRYLVSGGQDQRVIVWDFAASERVMVLDGHTAPVWSVAISPDMAFIASGSADGAVRTWDTHHIWGRASMPYFKAVNGLDKHSKSFNPRDAASEAKRKAGAGSGTAGGSAGNSNASAGQATSSELHPPKYAREPPSCRSFPTKYTPVHYVAFVNERLCLAAGSFSLPVLE